MTSEQLIEALKKNGALEEDVASRLKRESALSGRSVEEMLHERRLVDDKKVAEIKSSILGVPVTSVDISSLDEKLMGIIPEETVRTYGVVPISFDGSLLVAGMLAPDDLKAQEALKFIARRHRVNLGVYVISYGDWLEVLRKYSPYKSEVEAAVKSLNLKPGEGGRRLVSLEESARTSLEEAPIIKIVARTLEEAVHSKASDVHFEPQQNYLRVRFRIDGELREQASLPIELAQPVVTRIKVLSNLKIDESRIPQDGRFRSMILGREIDFRVGTFPTPAGEKVAIRVLDPTTGLRTLDQLGLVGRNLEAVKASLEEPFGMILITGPTGAGKTTTLYALLQTLNKENVNVVSLEDPVEYFISGVNQSQVRPEIGYDFASGIREIVRQDPDVIMVGEIRDNETAGLAIHAALTGHIVLSTLHTNNAAGTIPRLIDMKVDPFLLPPSLNLMVAQRLVSLLCENCKKAAEAPPAIQKLIKKALSGLPEELVSGIAEPYKIYHAEGCQVCHGRGSVGRIALFEVLRMTPALEEIINTGATLQRVVAEGKNQGMITLRQDGVLKALEGKVAIEEVLRETEED